MTQQAINLRKSELGSFSEDLVKREQAVFHSILTIHI